LTELQILFKINIFVKKILGGFMMKKIISTALISFVIILLSSCGEGTKIDLDTLSADATETPPITLECPGGLGCACDANKDCISGLCIDGEDGKKICTFSCVSECPAGWACNIYYDQKVCEKKEWDLCKPCEYDAQCGDENDFCIKFGATGAFCGMECQANGDCPAHFSCQKATTYQGAEVKQCIPDTGSCVCT
jgi:hypothetical protein